VVVLLGLGVGVAHADGVGLALADGVGVGLADGVAVGDADGVGVGLADGVGLGHADGVGESELLGELGLVLAEALVDGVSSGGSSGPDVAAQTCDRLKKPTLALPVVVFTVAAAAMSSAPAAEPTYARLALGGPNVVSCWVPPGLNVTVSVTKTVS